MIVADANLIAYLLIRGPHTPAAERAFERDRLWMSPAFWKSEFLNVLVGTVRAGMLTEREARRTWCKAVLTVITQADPDPSMVLRFALRRRLSAYDAHYVVLARTLNTLVVTGDKALVKRCPDTTVLVDDFAAG